MQYGLKTYTSKGIKETKTNWTLESDPEIEGIFMINPRKCLKNFRKIPGGPK